MTERDYLLVTALQRIRAAEALLGEAMPWQILPTVESRWPKILEDIRGVRQRLEEEVDRAMGEE